MQYFDIHRENKMELKLRRMISVIIKILWQYKRGSNPTHILQRFDKPIHKLPSSY